MTPASKGEIALAELDRVRAAGARFGCVLADAGYGASAAFRHGLDARGLRWAVGIPKNQKVYGIDVRLVPPQGRARTPVPSEEPRAAEDVLAERPWRRTTWRHGTKGKLAARFAAIRVRVADGPVWGNNRHLPGRETWLVGEWRTSGERKYYLSNLSPGTSVRALAAAIKARWVCEQAHQQLKGELGLGHFEGRSWTGLHRHALMTCIAQRVPLPGPVARIYKAVADLEALYPGRKFTPDGHLVGSIGEVIAAEALGLRLHKSSYPAHDAYDADSNVQIKMTAGSNVAMYATCERLVVLRVVSSDEAEIVYDGPGQPAWESTGKMGKNGQRVISLFRRAVQRC